MPAVHVAKQFFPQSPKTILVFKVLSSYQVRVTCEKLQAKLVTLAQESSDGQLLVFSVWKGEEAGIWARVSKYLSVDASCCALSEIGLCKMKTHDHSNFESAFVLNTMD